jgi:hypothetical protein
MTHDDSHHAAPDGAAPDGAAGRPAFDPRRSSEIRSLLVRTVAGTPRPRRARLSRPAFALAASVALLVAGGVGAGSVVAYDRLSGSVIASDAADSATESTDTGFDGQSSSGFEPYSDSSSGTTGAESTDDGTSEFTSDSAGELTPVLTLNGEVGYVYPGDLTTAVLLGATADTDIAVESASAFGGVPLYSADGATVLGYFDPAGLTP